LIIFASDHCQVNRVVLAPFAGHVPTKVIVLTAGNETSVAIVDETFFENHNLGK